MNIDEMIKEAEEYLIMLETIGDIDLEAYKLIAAMAEQLKEQQNKPEVSDRVSLMYAESNDELREELKKQREEITEHLATIKRMDEINTSLGKKAKELEEELKNMRGELVVKEHSLGFAEGLLEEAREELKKRDWQPIGTTTSGSKGISHTQEGGTYTGSDYGQFATPPNTNKGEE